MLIKNVYFVIFSARYKKEKKFMEIDGNYERLTKLLYSEAIIRGVDVNRNYYELYGDVDVKDEYDLYERLKKEVTTLERKLQSLRDYKDEIQIKRNNKFNEGTLSNLQQNLTREDLFNEIFVFIVRIESTIPKLDDEIFNPGSIYLEKVYFHREYNNTESYKARKCLLMISELNDEALEMLKILKGRLETTEKILDGELTEEQLLKLDSSNWIFELRNYKWDRWKQFLNF